MVTRQMSQLVGDDRAQLIGRQHVHEQESQIQAIVLPPQKTEPGDLSRARHEAGVKNHPLHPGGRENGPNLVDRIVKPRALARLDDQAGLWPGAEPERAQDPESQVGGGYTDEYIRNGTETDERDKRKGECADGDAQHEDNEPEAEPGEEHDLEAVQAWVMAGVLLLPLHQGHELLVAEAHGRATCAN